MRREGSPPETEVRGPSVGEPISDGFRDSTPPPKFCDSTIITTPQVAFVVCLRHMPNVPPEIATAEPRLIRPRDLRERYADPTKEVLRLAERGVLRRVAHGYYAVVPEEARGGRWRPSIEGVALGIGLADYGHESVALMGVSAARVLGAIPRALGAAVVAIEKQRPVLETEDGKIYFVARPVGALDVQRGRTELATGWVTTPEQTVLDLCDRPALGDQHATDVEDAIRELAAGRFDWALVAELAARHRKGPAAVRAARICGVEPPVRTSRPVDGGGLPGAAPGEA